MNGPHQDDVCWCGHARHDHCGCGRSCFHADGPLLDPPDYVVDYLRKYVFKREPTPQELSPFKYRARGCPCTDFRLAENH
jgi:hypothetical protein